MLNSAFSVLSASSGLSFDNVLFNLPISWFKLIIHCHRSKPKVIKNYQHSDYHLFSPSLDIDECSNKTHTCDVNAVCSNTQGSHNCTCKPGYSGDGKKCIAVGIQPPYRIPMILSTIILCCLVRKNGSVYEYFANSHLDFVAVPIRRYSRCLKRLIVLV